jgi:hypothetical protein
MLMSPQKIGRQFERKIRVCPVLFHPKYFSFFVSAREMPFRTPSGGNSNKIAPADLQG